MPKIAQYGEQQVQTGAVMGPQAHELPAGVFPASQLGTVLGDVANAAKQIAARASQTQAEEALVKFERAKNDMLFNPESGYLNKQGKTAYDQAKPTAEALDKLMRDHADSISDPDARNAFSRVASQHVTSAQETVMKHASRGLNAWEVDTLNAQVENVIENAALYRNDPKNLAVQRQLGLQTLLDSMDRQGITGDAREERVQNFESAFAGATITAAVSDSAAKGKVSFEKYGAALEEPDRIKIRKMLEEKQKAELTSTVSVAGVTGGRNIADQYYSQGMDAALKAVNTKYKDPQINRAVTDEVLNEFQRRDHIKDRTTVDAYSRAEDYLLSAKPGDPRSVNGFKAEHPDLWAAMDAKHQRNLEAGALTVTNQNVLIQIKSKPLNELAALKLADYADQLSIADRRDVQQMIDDARTGKHDIQVQTDSQFIADKVKQYGLKGEKEQEALLALQGEINRAVNAKGDSLSPQDRRNIITNSLSTFAVGQSFWFGSKEYTPKNTPIPELRAMNTVAQQLSGKLPEGDAAKIRKNVAAIRDDLADNGEAVNHGSILAEYLKRFPIKR